MGNNQFLMLVLGGFTTLGVAGIGGLLVLWRDHYVSKSSINLRISSLETNTSLKVSALDRDIESVKSTHQTFRDEVHEIKQLVTDININMAKVQERITNISDRIKVLDGNNA